MTGSRLSADDRRKVSDAVQEAERTTGLQFCVFLGKTGEDVRAEAERSFVQAGLHQRPAVLVLVSPEKQRAEVVTAPDARERLTDDECAASIAEMTPYFARREFVEGLIVGLRELAERTGPGKAPEGGPDLPDVMG